MINKLNKYGNLSGGYIFDYLDKVSHKEAIILIGECETISASIDYMGKITKNELTFTELIPFKIGDKKIIITTITNNKIFGKFIFIKCRDEKEN